MGEHREGHRGLPTWAVTLAVFRPAAAVDGTDASFPTVPAVHQRWVSAFSCEMSNFSAAVTSSADVNRWFRFRWISPASWVQRALERESSGVEVWVFRCSPCRNSSLRLELGLHVERGLDPVRFRTQLPVG